MLLKNFDQSMQPFTQVVQDTIAVSVSGGSDSMALALLLQSWCKKHHVTLVALIIDHQLRNNSTAEALQTQAWLHGHDITAHILNWQGEKPKSNIQAIAREKRYQLLTHYCKTHQITSLATGHHALDQLETTLMRLKKGCHIQGLIGIYPLKIIDDITIIRPLLFATKSQLMHYLSSQNQAWITDPSNQNLAFDRTHIRTLLSHSNQKVRLAKHALRLSHLCFKLDQHITQQLRPYQSQIASHPTGYITLPKNLLPTLPSMLGYRLLSTIIEQVRVKPMRLRFSQLALLLTDITCGKKRTAFGCLFFTKGEQLIICREPQHISNSLQYITENSAIWDHRFIITMDQPYHITSLDVESYKMLKSSLNKQLLPPFPVILTVPVVKSLEKIIAIPHINYYKENSLISTISVTAASLAPVVEIG